MQGASKQPGQQTSVKIYNAVYSSVQVYECMVRGIAVMRRRADSYVNATQILKVAGVDKGRRTKILEKEILPGKHEIVQGGYGKYQGTWIPLERGRELAAQYGIATLLSPLFDFTPTQQGLGGLSNSLSGLAGLARPLSAAASYPNLSTTSYSSVPSSGQLGPAPIMPGSALRLLNQGRAQGLFTPSTSSLLARSGNPGSPGNSWIPGLLPGFPSSQSGATSSSGQTEHTRSHSLKRTHTESDVDNLRQQHGDNGQNDIQLQQHLGSLMDLMGSRPSSSTPPANGNDGPSPTKRARTDPPNPQLELNSHIQAAIQSMSRHYTSPPLTQANGTTRTENNSHASTESKGSTNGVPVTTIQGIKMATRPPYPRNSETSDFSKNPKRSAITAAICQGDNAGIIINLIKEASPSTHQDPSSSQHASGMDIIIDELGHSPLHLAASLGQLNTVKALVENGADINRGNYQGETPLIRSVLSTYNYDEQTFQTLLEILHPSIWTIDSAKRSVLHHAALTAGVKGRAPFARYYLEGVLAWIAQHDNADFRSIVDLQDENGDTALNISARVGNKGLVRTLLDVGADCSLANKLLLRPGDFGVDPELASGVKSDDVMAGLRLGPSVPLQKSQDVIAELTTMIQKLSADFSAELKAKQDAYDVSNIHVKAATRELAEQRKQIDFWKQQHGDFDRVLQRVRNVEKALSNEDVDWTGRTEANGNVVKPGSGNPAFVHRGSQSATSALDNKDFSQNLEAEPPIPTTDSLSNLIKMRRMKMFQDRIEKVLRDRVQSLQGSSAEKEYQGKRIVALCTGLPIDKVEQMLDDILVAVESESSIVDFGRVSGFMQKVNESR